MKKIIYYLLLSFILIQFFRIDKYNPIVNQKSDFLNIYKTPPHIAKIIKTSCYDCHSNETKYPFYSDFQPIGWYIKNHINEGRSKLNFSTFSTYDFKKQAKKMKESAELTRNKEMPLKSFLLLHNDAKLSNEQQLVLEKYFGKIQQEIEIKNQLNE